MSTTARLSALESDVAEIKAGLSLLLAKLDADAPAKTTRKPAQKKSRAKKVTPTKGSQTRSTLSRKEWNRTLTAKARLAGGDTYKRVVAQWEAIQGLRADGNTPDDVLNMFA